MGDNFFDELFQEPKSQYVPPPIDFHQLFASTPPHQQQRMLTLIQQFQANIITLTQFHEQCSLMQQERSNQQQHQQVIMERGLRDRSQIHAPPDNRIHDMLRKRHPEPINTAQQKRMRTDEQMSPSIASGRLGTFINRYGKI